MEKEYRQGFRSGWLIDSAGNPVNEADALRDSTDAFGKRTAKTYRSVADIAAHHPHSPERRRLFLNGSEVFLQFASNAKFEDTADSYILKPAAGDSMEYRTSEIFRYAVGYIIEVSGAFKANQALVGDDKIVMGLGDPDLANNMASANGWFWERRGGDSKTVYLTTYRDGTEVDTETVTVENDVTDWQRVEDQINWYNVGNRVARETYTLNGDQKNPIVGKTSVDGDKGPSRGNFPFVYGVVSDASTTGLEIETGSVGISIIGDVVPIVRPKYASVTASHSGGGTWEPLFAVKKNPNDPNVALNLSEVTINEVSVDDDVEILVIAVPSSYTDASSYAVNEEFQNSFSTATLQTTTVTTFPDKDGNLVTAGSTIGGFQIGRASYYTAGSGQSRRESASKSVRKQSLPNTDEAIFLAKTDSAMNINIGYEFEQQW